MKPTILSMMLLWACCNVLAQTQSGEALKNTIAETFDYPVERLAFTDRSREIANRTGGQTMWAYTYTAADRTFAPMAIMVARKGVLLTSDVEAKYELALQQSRNAPNSTIQKISLSEGAYGYSGMGKFGPGASEEGLIITWPSRGLDLQVKIIIPGDPPLAVDAGTEVYNRLVTGALPLLNQRLVKAMERIMTQVSAASLTAATSPASEVANAHTVNSSNAASDIAKLSAAQHDSTRQGLAPESTDNFVLWPWLLGVALVAILCWVVVKFLCR